MPDIGALKEARQGSVRIMSVESGAIRPAEIETQAAPDGALTPIASGPGTVDIGTLEEVRQSSVHITSIESGAIRPARIETTVIERDAPAYTGAYDITPSEERMTLRTAGLSMVQDMVISPIPQNYGRILWDGHAITVY